MISSSVQAKWNRKDTLLSPSEKDIKDTFLSASEKDIKDIFSSPSQGTGKQIFFISPNQRITLV